MNRSAVLNKFKVFVLGASICLISAIARADDSTDTAKTITRCEACHGPRGDGAFFSIPRLNGQQAAYLASRFRSFSDPTRQDPHATNNMWPMASQVTDAAMAPIAKYFSGQAPTPLRSSGPLAAAGRKIYEQGAKGVPACQSCHGEQAEGKGGVPRLAGQHGGYLTAQMWSFNFMLRNNATMHPSVKYMTDEQIRSLVSYLASD